MVMVQGRKIAQRILRQLRRTVQNKRLKLSLAIVLTGNDPATQSFIRQKIKAAKEVGVSVRFYQLPKSVSLTKLKQTVKTAVKQHSGVIVQLPLPTKLKPHTQEISDLIPANKDPDVLSMMSWVQFLTNGKLLPPMAGAIQEIFRNYKINPNGKQAAVVGFGKLVGQPVSYWLAKKGSQVQVIDIGTKNKKAILKKADIIVSGVGKPGLIKPFDVKRGAVVIDAGTSEAGGRIVGDVDPAVVKKARLFSPVPGGVGPITVAMLFKNLIKLQRYK